MSAFFPPFRSRGWENARALGESGPVIFRFRSHLLLAAVLVGTAFAATPAPSYTGPQAAGDLQAPPRNEASGLAASRRNDDLLWTHDDSGGAEALYGVSTTGLLRATLRIADVKSADWEDIACVMLDGKAWLVIGDIGDNDGRRKRTTVYFVEEPAVEASASRRELSARPAAALRITYADGPRDCESLAIDVRERALYLLSKRDLVPRLYRVALPASLARSEDATAEFVTTVPDLARPTGADAFLAGLFEKGRARPCGMDIATDGSAAVVVTYADVLLFPRADGESWAAAFNRVPLRLPPHALPQAEAVCFSRDGRAIFVASEETRRFLRYERQP